MESHSDAPLIPLLLVSILAFLIPILTSWFSRVSKLQIPPVVGEIICGIIIGNSFLCLIESSHSVPWLDFLALFGFTYLMFLSGLEIDFGLIASESSVNKLSLFKRHYLKQPVVQAVIHFLLTLIMSSLVSLLLYKQGAISSWAMMTLILSTTSVSVVVPILKEKLLTKTLLGQTILISALTADFFTMILITIVVAFHTKALGSTTFIFVFFLGIILFVIYRLHISRRFDAIISKIYLIKPFIDELAHTTTQIKVRGAIALMVTFIVMSQMLGFEVILGAFLAGILTTLILGEEKTTQLEMKLDAIGYGFFIPIFFISVGIDIDLNVFFKSEKAWMLLVFLIIAAFIIKIIPSIVYRFNFGWKESMSAGVLLSARLSLIIAASTIGLREGMISEEVNSAIVMVAVITCIISPIIFNRIYSIKKSKVRNKIGIIGSGFLGRVLAEHLLDQKKDIIMVALNDQEYQDAHKRRLPVVHPGNSISETLARIEIDEVKILIVTTDYDDYNLSICMAARDNHSIKNIISLVTNTQQEGVFKEQNFLPVNKIDSTVDNILSVLTAPDAHAIFTGHEEEIKMADVWLTNTNFNNKALNTIKLPGDTLVVHIKRRRESLVPHGNTLIFLNDHLTLVGAPQSVEESIYLLGSPPDNYCPINDTYDL